MNDQFVTYQYELKDVLPSIQQAAEYLHLQDVEHPGYLFLSTKINELKLANFQAIGGYRLFNVEHLNIQEGEIRIGELTFFVNKQVCGYLRGATTTALFLCTAGSIFSTQYRDYSKKGDYLEAYITDSLGSLTVENAMELIQASLQEDMKVKGYGISNRYSPGYCNWPLKGQIELFKLIGDNPTKISLSSSCLMYPTKSVSGIIGIGPEMKRREYSCMICSNINCIYRRIIQNDK